MIASVSKVFAGAAIGILLDQEYIKSIDDDICQALPENWPAAWKKQACENPNPACKIKKVTWRMLATHRSSLIRDIPEVYDWESDNMVKAAYGPNGGYEKSAKGNPKCPLKDTTGFYRDILIKKKTTTTVGTVGIKTDTADEPGAVNWHQVALEEQGPSGMWSDKLCPGEKVEYSNFGIGYIAALVEHLTGDPFDKFVNEEIFDRLNMKNTKWFHGELGRPFAVPTADNKDVGAYCFIDYASGQLWTTARDMSLFMDEMLSMGVNNLWDESTSKHVFNCQEKDQENKPVAHEKCEFALTFELLNNVMREDTREEGDSESAFLKEFEHYDFVHGVKHSGSEAGVQSQLVILPRSEAYAFVVLNTGTENDEETPMVTKLTIKEAKKLRNSQT